MPIKSHDEIIDALLKFNDDTGISPLNEACEFLGENTMYSITNYAVICDDKLVCFTGSDIMDAENLCCFLRKKFTDKIFSTSDEFLSIE